jgi:adenosylhomocysteine nucleosidase
MAESVQQILVICPLKKELQALVGALVAEGLAVHSTRIKDRPVHEFKIGSCVVRAVAGGMGSLEYERQARYWLAQLDQVSRVICAGSAGALSPRVRVGDVVIGAAAILWGDGVHEGLIASVDEIVSSSRRALELFNQTGAIAVACEGRGGRDACAAHGIPFIEIRAITDRAEGAVAEIFLQNLEPAMKNLAKYLIATGVA